jgi:hypothetical protein
MFDFINRAASIGDPAVALRLDELIPFGDWRSKLDAVERTGDASPKERKAILIEAFGQSLKRLGNYDYVAETTVLRPLKDRPLYCLFYATRHPKGIGVPRLPDCSFKRGIEDTRSYQCQAFCNHDRPRRVFRISP